MLSRNTAPDLKPIGHIQLEKPEHIVFKNGLQGFVFHAPEQELIKAEFVFKNLFEDPENPIRNSALSSMLKEGTSKLSSAQIASKIDYYGAYLVPEFSFDHNALTLYSLSKHVQAVLPVVHDVLTNAQIPQLELDTYIKNNKQSLQISLEKNDFVARRTFYQNLFGATRYGRTVTQQLLSDLNQPDLISLYKQQIQPQNATLFLSGNISNETIALFKSYFEEQWQGEKAIVLQNFVSEGTGNKELQIIDRADALQSSIRLGKESLQRIHPDYPALQFVNTLFGGYFGSRLMSNIREDKGYTYSIGSMVANLNHAGFFSISTDVGTQYAADTLVQIQKEIDHLQQEKADDNELDLVRNYMLGSMLGSLESIFSHVDKFKSVYFSGLDLDYYQYYTDSILNIQADRVQDLAQQYLGYDDMLKIVVGKISE
ncbi:pitrilysin family protein [Sphingobacterium kyonggiense]|uniref:Pitrilysin family protein n=1 Tax=Sphingobacterium kyonggiense TaxID=714075 RepID=A0ABP7YT12_9SPHI